MQNSGGCVVADGKSSETSLMNQMADSRAMAQAKEQSIQNREEASFQQPKIIKVKRVQKTEAKEKE